MKKVLILLVLFLFSCGEELPLLNIDVVPPAVHSVVFYSEGEILLQKNVENGSNVFLTNLVKNGAIFNGWYLDPSFVVRYVNEPVYSSFNLYAKWTEIPTYFVRFYSDGSLINSTNILSNDIIIFPNVSKTDYKLSGWYFDSSFTRVINTNNFLSLSNFRAYAKWKEWIPKVIILSNGGSGAEGTMQNVNFIKNEEVSLPLNTFTKRGWNFVGWATQLNGPAVYSNGEAIVLSNNATLYAVWSPPIIFSIGDIGMGGGIVFFDNGNYSLGWRYKEASPYSLGDYTWDMAKIRCINYAINSLCDWYLPSRGELFFMRSSLIADNLGNYPEGHYWSSNEYSTIGAYTTDFINSDIPFSKEEFCKVIAIRKF